VENQCYLAASAQGGRHPSGRLTYGHSMIVDPWGAVIDQLADGPGVVVGDVDLDHMAAIRQSLPALGHRRL
jgi:nitrilase